MTAKNLFMRPRGVAVVVSAFLLSGIVFPAFAHAFSFANTYVVADQAIVPGDIIADVPGTGLVREDAVYDDHLFGIAIEPDKALILYQDSNYDPTTSRVVLKSGNATVTVTDYNGKILAGDYVTSSPIAGKGMRSTQAGYVLGLATSSFVPTGTMSFGGKTYQVGQVNISLAIQFIEASVPGSRVFLETIGASVLSDIQNPGKFSAVFRYILGGLLALASFIFGFVTFGRSISKGIEAIGRNPLARASIQASIIFQLFMTVVTSLIGVAIAFIIIRL